MTAFHDLPAKAFPITIEYRDAETDELLLTDTITGPGAYFVKGFQPRRVSVTLIDGTGHSQKQYPPEEE